MAQGADIKAVDSDGETLLHAIARGKWPEGKAKLKICKELTLRCLEAGVDINQRTYEDQETPIFVAADEGNEAAIKFLVEHGADVSIPNDEGISPLMRAMIDCSPETFEV